MPVGRPFETDLGAAKSLILWGMNPGASSLPSMRGYTDLQMQTGLKIIMVDPRYSETASKADLWLPLRPGSDSALALALLHTIIFEGLYDWEFVRAVVRRLRGAAGPRDRLQRPSGPRPSPGLIPSRSAPPRACTR